MVIIVVIIVIFSMIFFSLTVMDTAHKPKHSHTQLYHSKELDDCFRHRQNWISKRQADEKPQFEEGSRFEFIVLFV